MTEANNEGARAGIPVSRRRPAHHWTLVCAALLAFGLAVERSAAGHREHQDRDIWFVHATDPHLFIQPGRAGREEQQRQNQEAFSDLFKWIGSLPDGYGSPAFLVLTGDLGVDPCDIRQAGAQPGTPTPAPTPTAQRNAEPAPEADEATRQETLSADDCLKVKQDQHDSQIKITARIFGESPVQDIYLIAGNNDIAAESAGDPALRYFNDFIQDVQKELIKNKSSVRLHNLTHCYVAGEASGSCYADIPHSAYRLIGFPSYSFRSSDEKAQRAQFEKFRQLLEASRKQGMKALVITHTPEMDDPFALAQQRYVNSKATTAALSVPTPTPAAPAATPAAPAATPAPAETATPAETSTPRGTATPTPKTKKTQLDKSFSVATWNVSDKLLDDWKGVVASDSIAGVFAGHLHDSHKEIYRPPYAWSSGNQTAFHKLFLAPPLAVKNQTDSPIQARGFSLVHLQSDRVESRLFWYDSETSKFTPEPKHKHHWRKDGFWRCLCQSSSAAIRWLWDLEKTDSALIRMAIIAIAFLTAFLTIVATWQIPPGSDPFADVKKTAEGGAKTAESGSKPAPTASNAAAESLPFSSRFGKTVIGGLAGLVAAEVTKTLGNEKPSADSRWYYIVWFILFFFLLLLSLNLWRAFVEAFRARVAVIYYTLPRVARSPSLEEDETTRYLKALGSWIGYWLWQRPTHWLSSLQVPLLTFSDTFINLIQGRNQTRTKVFEQTIIDQQRNVLRVVDTIRKRLHNTILDELRIRLSSQASRDHVNLIDVRPADVRVNISVLSRDQSNVFYISRAPGSSRLPFLKRSVAWVSVFTGQIRWYKESYRHYKDLFREIILFDNSAKTIADSEPQIQLSSHYQPRSGEDYKAFVVFPFPWPQRGFGSDYVKGAVHISFRHQSHFDLIWPPKKETETDKMEKTIKAAQDIDQRSKTAEETKKLESELKTEIDRGRQPAKDLYNSANLTLDWCATPQVGPILYDAVLVLGELLRQFNEIIYKNYIEPEQPD